MKRLQSHMQSVQAKTELSFPLLAMTNNCMNIPAWFDCVLVYICVCRA